MRFVLFLGVLFVTPSAFADRWELPKHSAPEPKLDLKARPAPEVPDTAAACRAKLKLDEAKLTELEKKIWAKVQEGKEVAFDQVTEAWIDLHLRAFNQKHKSALSSVFLRGLLQRIAVGAGPDPFSLKKDAEQRLEKTLLKRTVVYNAENDSPVDLITRGKAQCYAGTVCYSWLGRMHWGREGYLEKRPVIVFSKGHTFPAFVLPDDKGERWLVGVETTVSGEARRPIGKISELEKLPDAYRVIDANAYALLEIFKPHLKPDALECWQNEALASTAKAHGFDLAKLEGKVAAEAKTTPGSAKEHLGALGFGIPKTPAGDQTRTGVPATIASPSSEPGPLLLPGMRPLPPRLDPEKQKARLEARAKALETLTRETKQDAATAEATLRRLEVILAGTSAEEFEAEMKASLEPLKEQGLRSVETLRSHLREWSRLALDGDEHPPRKR